MELLIVKPYCKKTGIIFKEYVDTYTRELTTNDYQKMMQLLKENKLQEFINEYNVRKITFSSKYLQPHDQLFKLILATNNIQFINFVYKKLSYNDKAYLILSIEHPFDNQLSQYIKDKIEKFDGDYEEDFPKIMQYI